MILSEQNKVPFDGDTVREIEDGLMALDNHEEPDDTLKLLLERTITTLNVPEGVTKLGEDALLGAYGLTTVTIPSSVVSIDTYAFFNCIVLSNVTLSEGLQTIMNYALANCTGLKTIEIPSTVTSIETNAFLDSGLTSIRIHKPTDSIEGAPWGATNATITWDSAVEEVTE